MSVKHLDHINLSTSNLDVTCDWYGRVFGFEEVERGVWNGIPWRIIRSGEAMLCLYEKAGFSLPSSDERQETGALGINHFALRIEDVDTWKEKVASEDVNLWHGPIDYPASTSWYVNDPAGYEVEVVHWNGDRVSF